MNTNTEIIYPIIWSVRFSAIFEFNIVFTLAGELCKIQIFFPSKDMAEAAGQLITNIAAIKSGDRFEKYSFIFSIPIYPTICSTGLNNKNILKIHKSITPNPAFNISI